MLERLSAVVLAAGASQRMGDVNKLLADWQGKPMVRQVVETALNSGMGEVLVVTGFDADAVRSALEGLDVGFVHNPDFEEGLSSTLKAGVSAVGADRAGAVILLADMPALKILTLQTLIEAFNEADSREICVPVCGSRRGNPVVWPREFFPDILELSGDKGARDLMNTFSDRVQEVPCEDQGVLMDIDTPDDLEPR